jgi:hypothetical protein
MASSKEPELKTHPSEVVWNHASTVREASPVNELSGSVVDVPPAEGEIAPGAARAPGLTDVVAPTASELPFPEEST